MRFTAHCARLDTEPSANYYMNPTSDEKLEAFCMKEWGMTADEVSDARLAAYYYDALHEISKIGHLLDKTNGGKSSTLGFLSNSVSKKLRLSGVLKMSHGKKNPIDLDLLEKWVNLPCVASCYNPN